MIVVFAGNRVDTPSRATPRFPDAHAAAVRRRIHDALTDLRPDGVVVAAAAGADLLALRVALELSIPAHVLLPHPEAQFVSRSVADAGSFWIEEFGAVLALARHRGGDVTCLDLPATDEAYREFNGHLLDRAAEFAGGGAVTALVVRPDAPASPPSVTDDFAARAKARQWPVREIDPTANRAARPWWKRWRRWPALLRRRPAFRTEPMPMLPPDLRDQFPLLASDIAIVEQVIAPAFATADGRALSEQNRHYWQQVGLIVAGILATTFAAARAIDTSYRWLGVVAAGASAAGAALAAVSKEDGSRDDYVDERRKAERLRSLGYSWLAAPPTEATGDERTRRQYLEKKVAEIMHMEP